MARRRYRRSYRRRSGRWAPNIVKISNTITATPGEFSASEDLASNSIQVNTGVSQTYTVKNFEITFNIESSSTIQGYLEALTAYIMFVPQGMTITSSYYAQHPEYIMAYKYLGSPASDVASPGSTNYGQNYQPYRIRTRLSRKLQTGDRIILYIQGSNENTSNTAFNIAGIVRWWSKAN